MATLTRIHIPSSPTIRAFNAQDQLAFAELSGDYNPLHVDETAARRLMFGQRVAHGIHLLLWALECWSDTRDFSFALSSIRSHFIRPIGVGETVGYVLKEDRDGRVMVNLMAGRSVVTKIQFDWTPAGNTRMSAVASGFPKRQRCREWAGEAIATAQGEIGLRLDQQAVQNLFPRLTRLLPPIQLAGLLATTRLVGVECPGQHSVYSQLALRYNAEQGEVVVLPAVLKYMVSTFDPRFNLVEMNVAAPGMTGTVRAFLRPLPREQMSYDDMTSVVEPGEFAGQQALVVGGSRGLGEVTAKLLAAGGAKVEITYHHGTEDAQRVVDEIRTGGGSADCRRLDVLAAGDAEPGEAVAVGPTHLYYFATPFIAPGEKGSFSPDRFASLCQYYVTGFAGLFERLAKRGLKQVFYPSSVYVDDPPPTLGEYAAAKQAGEVLCRFLEKSHRGIQIHHPRLPRLATDQTASLMPLDEVNPVPVLLTCLRRFNRPAAE